LFAFEVFEIAQWEHTHMGIH